MFERLKRRRRGANGGEKRGRGPAPGARRGVYGLVAALATVVDLLVGIVCLVILAGILLVVLGANEDNTIAGAVLDAGEFLVGPFDNIFTRDSPKEEVAINWGIALVVYFIAGRLIAALLRRGER